MVSFAMDRQKKPKIFRHYLMISLLAFCSGAHSEPQSELSSIVWVPQTRSFSDVDRLRSTLDLAPVVEINNPPGRSPSELIRRQYGFGISDSQEAYSAIEAKVLSLNGAKEATLFPAGKIIIPDIPKMTSTRPSESEASWPVARNNSKIIRSFTSYPFDSPSIAYTKPITISNPIQESLNYGRIDRYSATDAAQLISRAAEAGESIVAGSEAEVQISSNSTDCDNPSQKVLSEDDREIISRAISESTTNIERYLIIVDTGWPNYEQQALSLQAIRRIFNEVRTSLKVPENGISKFKESLPEGSFSSPTHPHACMIYQSLIEFTSIDKKNTIKIVYIPLRPGQPGAKDYFRELLELDFIIQAKGHALYTNSPSNGVLESARAYADKALKEITALKEPWSTGDDVVRIFEPVTSGLIRVFDAYTKIDDVSRPGQPMVHARFWISLSWNFTKYSAAPSLPSSSAYLVFVAAGNDQTDFVASRRLFASEAAMGYRVFTVMNSDESSGGLTCKSARINNIWNEQNIDSNIASFPGRLSNAPSSICPGSGGGTSFSTPRLAWISAATDISFENHNEYWPKALSKRLLKSRTKVESDPNAAPISIKLLFKK
ncbi:hypothetical protein [Metapseudomonas furukawaii]|uniref:Peptidase S8/S53 domain-containing protein n=1 Tax=Metapseudomonas furukawaii TaxID=1149133 RepID=A0AAD1C1L7_METFU|nr:hypothetical protein [Pseudomonas furukawaii]ELS26639.1 hypothetical protein ppKF707_3057 [Pseudomonas furukawaii]BAU74403.1 hypothetical protein KF707C_27150 [Pseudomonas furukawaii]